MEQLTAIVTGGGGAIGAAAAHKLADRAFRVLVVDTDPERANETAQSIEGLGGVAKAHVADVSVEEDVRGYVRTCSEHFGPPHAFFNNAAIAGPLAEIPSYSAEEFDRVLAVNLRGVFLGLHHVIPAMQAAGRGAIVNTASGAGIRGAAGFAGYVASKHGVVGLSRTAALECAPTVRVNCICPGATATPMMRGIEDAITASGGDTSGIAAGIPAGRYGEADEIGGFAAWLLADAPGYLTGAVISIDGGVTAG